MVYGLGIYAAFLAPAMLFAQSAGPRVRVLRWDSTHTIASRLLPDDEVVLISTGGLDLVSPTKKLTVRQIIEDAAVLADLVVLVDVDAVDGVLSAGGSWIDTRLMGTVRDVLRVSKGYSISRGQSLEVRQPGGEVMIGNVIVRAPNDHHVVPQLPAHRSYLLFLMDDNGVLRPLHRPVLIDDNKLVYPWQEQEFWYEPPGGLQGLTVNEVAEIVRRAKTSWSLGEKPSRKRQ